MTSHLDAHHVTFDHDPPPGCWVTIADMGQAGSLTCNATPASELGVCADGLIT